MPQVFKVGSYWVYFWSDESMPLEPIHVHIAKGAPVANGTKVWLTSSGHCLLCHNKSKIPRHILHNIMRVIEARNQDVKEKWYNFFGEITYYC
ncbi:MAG: DUF4160 domain-containing protein [Selenomonas sp.]|nr:DUF4160 domain-containing protein [Selenomonas sp.]MCI7330183.1 DUF4160 domain-containing protein [Selenomonadaceae bacterium]MDD7055966.1 DUF4160 domain-containing protein [Selenomonadaceae bacterium]MDY3915278.1 DUF4160 domain-containing protein [Selenomonadaceae bacterium]